MSREQLRMRRSSSKSGVEDILNSSLKVSGRRVTGKSSSVVKERYSTDNFDLLKLRDYKQREGLITNFLTQESDLIIIVIDQFTATEKQLIDRIKLSIEARSKRLQQLIIVHNYF